MTQEEPSSQRNKTFFNKLKKNKFVDRLLAFFGFSSSNDIFFNSLKELKKSSESMSLDEKNIINNFLKFCKKTVNDVVIPRANIRAIDKNASLDEMNSLITKFSHTRTIVYEDNLDNIIGFIHIKDVFNVIARKQNFSLKKLIRTHIIAPAFMKLIDLLAEMQRKRVHIAVVVDEYGGTEGIVTIEDIMEEIVGEIEDEFDENKPEDEHNYKIIDTTTLITDSRVKVEIIESLLDQKLKTDENEFDTIGGLILAKIGHVPTNGTVIKINNKVSAEVIQATPRTLKRIKLTLKSGHLKPIDSEGF